MMKPFPQKIAVIGAGISGLKIMQLLLKHENITSIHVYEKEKVGGVLQSYRENGFLLEMGAQGVLHQREPFARTLEELRQDDIEIHAVHSKARRRYLIWGNSLVALGPQLFLKKVLSFFDFIRIVCELFVKRSAPNPQETLYDFVARRFGSSCAQRIIIPIATGIWGGAARHLLVRFTFPKLQEWEAQHGSLLNAFLFSKKNKGPKGLVSFKDGMHELAHALGKHCEKLALKKNISLRWFPEAIKINNHAVFTSQGFEEYDLVIVASSPWLLPQNFIDHPAWKTLHTIPTHHLVVVGWGKNQLANPYPGFGCLAPESSSDLLGILNVHDIFPEHAPAHAVLYRLLFGGDRDPTFHLKSDEEIKIITQEHLKRLGFIEKDCEPDFLRIVRWPSVVPLATNYQDKVLVAVQELEHEGYRFVGNYLQGVGVADCLLAAEQCYKNLRLL